ncbi:MAG TPA: RloB family protein [Rugosimonospora sp.]|nr:RloB family protein [Rugosimonospora sp.]
MPRRENSAARRGPVRRSRPLVLVVCGGERTEPQYLRGLRDHVDNRAVDLKILEKGRDPEQVVAYAAGVWARSPRDFDEVWCVVDVDEFDLDRAVLTAADAVRRARALDGTAADSSGNPSSSVWRLVETITT